MLFQVASDSLRPALSQFTPLFNCPALPPNPNKKAHAGHGRNIKLFPAALLSPYLPSGPEALRPTLTDSLLFSEVSSELIKNTSYKITCQ